MHARVPHKAVEVSPYHSNAIATLAAEVAGGDETGTGKGGGHDAFVPLQGKSMIDDSSAAMQEGITPA
jgi:hypothetical protein